MMRALDPSGMSVAVRRLNGLVAEVERAADAATGIPASVFGGGGEEKKRATCVSPVPAGEEAPSERDFQAAAERWLEGRGYARLTAENAEQAHGLPAGSAAGPRGWYGHLQETRGNPLMPDVWVMAGGRVLCVELKRAGRAIRWQAGQCAMVSLGVWELARDMVDFTSLVKRWEGGA